MKRRYLALLLAVLLLAGCAPGQEQAGQAEPTPAPPPRPLAPPPPPPRPILQPCRPPRAHPYPGTHAYPRAHAGDYLRAV